MKHIAERWLSDSRASRRRTSRPAMRTSVPSGEIGCLAWLSYETKQPVDQLMDQVHTTGDTCQDMALQKSLLTESMEIAAGLVYSDYIDKPHPLK